MFLLVAHFVVEVTDPGQADQGGDRAGDEVPVPATAREPLAMLAQSPQCRRLRFARSTDDGSRYVLTAEFGSAADYRRSLSPWPMRTVVVPWLSTADQRLSAVNEVVLAADEGTTVTSTPTVPDPGR